MVREKEVSDAEIWPVRRLMLVVSPEAVMPGRDLPCSAGVDAEGASVKASRSRRTDEDCLRAELKREFYIRCQCVSFKFVW